MPKRIPPRQLPLYTENPFKFIAQTIAQIKLRGFMPTFRQAWATKQFRFGDQVGELRGVDEFGNRYYEALDQEMFKTRWVEYQDPRLWHDPSEIPPEWHPWIHYTVDSVPGDSKRAKKKFWELPHRPNQSMTQFAYFPPKGRDKSPYEKWNPNQQQKSDVAKKS